MNEDLQGVVHLLPVAPYEDHTKLLKYQAIILNSACGQWLEYVYNAKGAGLIPGWEADLYIRVYPSIRISAITKTTAWPNK